MKKWEVPIVYRGQANYVVEAETAREAEKLARRMFEQGDKAPGLGNEWEDLDYVGDITEVLP